MALPTYRVPSTPNRAWDGTWLHHFQCPICGTWHTHGGQREKEPRSYGTRVPHCVFVRSRQWHTIFVLDKDYDFDIRPADESVDWESEYRAANAHVVAQVEAADLQRKDREILIGRLSRNLEKALKTLP